MRAVATHRGSPASKDLTLFLQTARIGGLNPEGFYAGQVLGRPPLDQEFTLTLRRGRLNCLWEAEYSTAVAVLPWCECSPIRLPLASVEN
jgi:hypothetical protein